MKSITSKEFLALIGADHSFVIMRDKEKGVEFLPYNEKLLERLSADEIRISTGGKISGVISFDLEKAYKTRVIAVIDIDSFDDQKFFEFLKDKLPPTIKLKTRRGWHYLYMLKDEVKLRESEEDKSPTEYYDMFFSLRNLFRKVTPKLKEIDQKVDKIDTLIYTRISDEVYIFDVFYTFEEFLEKVREVFSLEESSDVIGESKVPIIEDIFSVKKSKSYILNAPEFCEVLKEIINNPEKHTYFQWLIFARHMANLDLLGYTWAEEKFHELASKYFDYDKKQNEKLFKYYVDKGFAFLSCKLLKSDVCKNCPNKSGTPYSYRDIFMVQNLVEMDGKFYKVLNTQYGHLEEYLCPAFHIEEELKIEGKKDKEFYIVLNVNGEKKLINGNNYKKEIIAELDSGNYSPKEVNLIIDQYLHETKIKRLKNIFFVRKIKNQIDYFEDGFDILTYDEEYLEFLIKSRIVPHHVYMKKSNSQVFFEKFKKLFKVDIPIRIITSFSLIQELYNTKYTFTTNPILLISGAPSSGKTKRLHIVQSFWTKPESTARISDKDLSHAYLLYTHSKVRVPLWIDDLKFDDAKDAERLIFTLSNQNRRSIALSNFISEPLRSVTIATLENNTLNVFKPFFETETGFIRRFLLLQIKDTEKENKQEIIELIDVVWTLALENYGHAKFFYDRFRFDEELYIKIRNKVREVPLIYDGFYDLLAGLITYDIKMHEFLGLEYNIEEEIKLFASHLGILKESEYDVLYSKDIENKFDKYLHITHKNISYILDHYNLRNKPIQLLGKFTLDYKQIFKSLTEPDISGEIIKVLLFNFSFVNNNPKFILSTQLYSVRALLSSDMHDALIENTLKFIVNNFSNYKVYFPEKVRKIENMVGVDFLTYILYCYLSYLLQTDPFKVNKFITNLEGNYKNQVKINMLKSLIEEQQAEYKEETPQAEGTSDEPDIPF